MKRAVLLFLVLGLYAASVHVAAAQSASIAGQYVVDRSASDDVNAAIGQAVAKMNFAVRPIARGRLRKTNVPYERIVAAQTGTQISLTFDQNRPMVSPASGSPVKWTRADGEVVDLSTKWQNGSLEQTIKAEDGQRVNTFTLSADSRTLTMHVTVTSPRLPKPLAYKLVYRRAS